MDIFDKSIVNEVQKVVKDESLKLLENPNYGFNLDNKWFENSYGPVFGEKAQMSIAECAMTSFWELKEESAQISMWSFKEDDDFVSRRLISNSIIRGMENLLDISNKEAVCYFKKGPLTYF